MQVSYFFPSLDLTVSPDGKLATFTDSDTGFLAELNGSDITTARGTPPWRGMILQEASRPLPVKYVLDYEARYFRKQGPPTKLLPGDIHDTTGNPGNPSDGRRRFVFTGMGRALRGLVDGFDACKSYSGDQTQRPMGHALSQPFVYKGYYGVSADGARFDTYDNVFPGGFSSFNVAHLACHGMFDGAALGDEGCLFHLICLAMFFFQSFPGAGRFPLQKGWTGSHSPRAVGEVWQFEDRCARLGIGIGPNCARFRDMFLCGADPKEHLIGHLRDNLVHPQGLGSNNIDVRVMPDIGTYAGRRAIEGFISWQWGILASCWGYVRDAGTVNDPLKSQVDLWVKSNLDTVLARCYVPGKGLAQDCSVEADYDQAAYDAAVIAQDPKYPLDVTPLPGFIRKVPKYSIAELTGTAAMFYGMMDVAKDLVLGQGVYADPTKPDLYKWRATYEEPVLAALETT